METVGTAMAWGRRPRAASGRCGTRGLSTTPRMVSIFSTARSLAVPSRSAIRTSAETRVTSSKPVGPSSSGTAWLEGDCDFFEGKTFTLTPFSNCRAGGDAVATVFAGGNTARFYGNTIANIRGNDAFLIGPRKSSGLHRRQHARCPKCRDCLARPLVWPRRRLTGLPLPKSRLRCRHRRPGHPASSTASQLPAGHRHRLLPTRSWSNPSWTVAPTFTFRRLAQPATLVTRLPCSERTSDFNAFDRGHLVGRRRGLPSLAVPRSRSQGRFWTMVPRSTSAEMSPIPFSVGRRLDSSRAPQGSSAWTFSTSRAGAFEPSHTDN